MFQGDISDSSWVCFRVIYQAVQAYVSVVIYQAFPGWLNFKSVTFPLFNFYFLVSISRSRTLHAHVIYHYHCHLFTNLHHNFKAKILIITLKLSFRFYACSKRNICLL